MLNTGEGQLGGSQTCASHVATGPARTRKPSFRPRLLFFASFSSPFASQWRLVKTSRQPERHPFARQPQASRLRLTAWACLLLFLFGSTVQAAHTHGPSPASAKVQVSPEAGLPHAAAEELCPLCAAMHGASAAPTAPALQLAAAEPASITFPADRSPVQAWNFELFGRPPPVSL